MATFSDGTTKDVTGSATWSSNVPGVASVVGGTVTGISPGQAIITATLDTMTANATVTVNRVVQSIALTPAAATINAGSTQGFTATAMYSDGTTAQVTTTATWSTSNAAVATVNATGLASGIAAGAATIRATIGAVSGSATLTVQSPRPSLQSAQCGARERVGSSLGCDGFPRQATQGIQLA